MILRAAIPALFALTACAPQPMTPERAARLCLDEARQADGISGSVGVGVGSDGPVGSGSITISSEIFNPRSEQEALQECVDRRMAGRPAPTRGGIRIGGSL